MLIAEQKKIENYIESQNVFDLSFIHKQHINIAVWNRNYRVTKKIKEKLDNGFSFEFKESGSIEFLLRSLKTFFVNTLPWEGELYKDIKKCFKIFNELASSKSYRIWFATERSNMCKRFHTDINDLRLLCTYYGPGTLWLTEDNINRSALDACKQNESIVINENKIKQVHTGDVAIMKGSLFNSSDTLACVHKSPSIEMLKKVRLILRIDTNDFFESLI